MPRRKSGSIYTRKDRPGRIYLRMTVGGERIECGSWEDTAVGRSEADKERRRRLGKDADGLLADPTSFTVEQYINGWVDGLWVDVAAGVLRENTRSSYRGDLTNYVIPHIGNERIQNIRRGDIKKLIGTLITRGGRDGKSLSPKTVKNIVSVLRVCFNEAVEDGILIGNPVVGVKAPKQVRKKVATWRPEEVGEFVRNADQFFGALWHLVATTGIRRSEALGLRWSDVDVDDIDSAVIHINTSLVQDNHNVIRFEELTKTRSSRRSVPIDTGTAEVLKRHRVGELEKRMRLGADYIGNDHDLVFTDEIGRWVSPNRITRTFQREAVRLGLEPIGVHGLRHSFGTNAVRAGADIKLVSLRLGHSSVQITMDLYVHPDEQDLRAGAAIGAAMIGGVA